MNLQNITFPSGKTFSSSPCGCDGIYKKKVNGIMFLNNFGEPIFFMKKAGRDRPFMISATKQSDGKIWYSYLSSKTEKEIGFDSLSQQSAFCENLNKIFFGV